YVRPLLRSLGRLGTPAMYPGRDWIQIGKNPVGTVGAAFDAGTGRAAFEASVAVSSPLVPDPSDRFLGRPPASLQALVGRSVDVEELARTVLDAYRAAYDPAPTT